VDEDEVRRLPHLLSTEGSGALGLPDRVPNGNDGWNAAKQKEPRSALPRRLSANLERITASAPTNHKLERWSAPERIG
jgi:hypothetical protein